MTYIDLDNKLHDHLFKPFRIRMVNNTTYDVTEPWMIIVGESSAIVVTHVRADDRGHQVAEWRTISISHILGFQDLDIKPKEKRRPA